MSFPGLKKYIPGDKTWFDGAQSIVNRILMGKLSNVHNVNLNMAPGSTTTVVPLANGQVGPDTHVALDPTNLAAAQALASGTLYVSSRDAENNTITITHAVDTSMTRSFKFTLTG